MIKSIFFRALTLLGLTFVLIGCGAADPGEGGTGTGTSSTPAALTEANVKAMAEEMIKNSRGKIDSSKGEQVAWKILSIIKAAQPNNSCSLFTHLYLTAATNWSPYETTDKMYNGGGKGTFTVIDSTATSRAATTGFTVVNGILTYEFKNFTIDGNYFLNGAFKMKMSTASAATAAAGAEAAAGALTLEAAAGDVKNVLTLSEKVDGAEAKPIGQLTLDTGFAHTVVASGRIATAATAMPCGSLAAAGTSTATVTKAGTSAFGEIKMGTTTAYTMAVGGVKGSYAAGAGNNLDMFTFLIGPKA